MSSWFTFAFLAAASALTWLGVRLLGVRLGPTDWLDAVDLGMTNKNLISATGDPDHQMVKIPTCCRRRGHLCRWLHFVLASTGPVLGFLIKAEDCDGCLQR